MAKAVTFFFIYCKAYEFFLTLRCRYVAFPLPAILRKESDTSRYSLIHVNLANFNESHNYRQSDVHTLYRAWTAFAYLEIRVVREPTWTNGQKVGSRFFH